MELNQERYSRQIRLDEIGIDGQKKLSQASVLVVGAGGLGCPIIQYLVAAGVGRIRITDGDLVSESNLHRQILFGMGDVGQPKVEVARRWILNHNSDLIVEPIEAYISTGNVFELLDGMDVVVDGSDNFSTKYLLNDACEISQIPLVSGAIFQFTGQVSVFHYKGGPSYRCLYPDAPHQGEIPNCVEAGVLGVLPGVVGSIQANEVLKVIVGYGEVLSGKLFTLDLQYLGSSVFEFERSATRVRELESSYTLHCELPSGGEISVQELEDNYDSYLVLDVREAFELEIVSLAGALHVSLKNVVDRMGSIPIDKPIAVLCHHGMRSAQAQQLLESEGYQHVVNVRGGIDAYSVEVNQTLKRY
jgi:adenylyltransferase/sulfurtransferase